MYVPESDLSALGELASRPGWLCQWYSGLPDPFSHSQETGLLELVTYHDCHK
jgi:hypothetical protein